MSYQPGSTLNELRISRLATAVVRVVEKRVLQGLSQRRLWREARRLPDAELRVLQLHFFCLSLQLAEELQNFYWCLDQVDRWNKWQAFLFGHRRFLGERERIGTLPSSELIAPGEGC